MKDVSHNPPASMSEELTLTQFIESNPDPRELKRALAVQMVEENFRYVDIQSVLQVSVGFITKWKQQYMTDGVLGLRLAYKGSKPYLEASEQEAVQAWLKARQYWHLPELEQHLQETYGVVFASKQSYYELFHAAGISWKKTQTRNPKKDPALVSKKKTELTDWVAKHRREIESGELVVLFQDECHLLWGDTCGYVWGKSNQRIEVPITNTRARQTYYGTIDLLSHQCLIFPYDSGNEAGTIAFLKYLQQQYPKKRLAILWDGASYHRSEAVRAYLETLNQGLPESEWLITCIRFAPNDPSQNPIEDVWLQGKRVLREWYHGLSNFKEVKELFEFFLHRETFNFEKLSMYGSFS